MNLKEIESEKINKILNYKDRIGSNLDPVCVQAAITDYCFNTCLNCDHHLRKNKKKISGVDWIDFLSNHKLIESVAYLGGDIMTHPDLNEIMEYHVDNNTAFGIVSCGYIPNKTNLHLLSNARWFRVSLDTLNSSLYKKIRGGVELSEILNSIDIAIKEKVNVGLEITVSKYNDRYLRDIFNYAMNKRLAVEVHPCFESIFSPIAEEVIGEYKDRFKEAGLEFSFFCYSNFKFKKCIAPYYQIYIDTDGDIYPCCASSGDLYTKKNELIMGNISDWNSFLENRSNHKMIYKACRFCCDNTTRINYVVENYQKKKNFF